MSASRFDAVDLIGGLMGSAAVAAFLIPFATDKITAVDTSAYSSGMQAAWSVFELVIVLVFFLGLLLMASRTRLRG